MPMISDAYPYTATNPSGEIVLQAAESGSPRRKEKHK
jgi:hypothetical protein